MTRGRPLPPDRKKREPPMGTRWRILAWVTRGHGRLALYSRDYLLGMDPKYLPVIKPLERVSSQTTFDELVIEFGGGGIHIEQMNTREWFLSVGEEKVMITVDKDGVPRMGEGYR